MKRKTAKITLTLTIFLALAMFAGCGEILSSAIDEPTTAETSSGEASSGGTGTAPAGKILVVANLESAESSSRAAVPSVMSSIENFSYFGALKTSESDASAVYEKGTLSGGKLTFEFDLPSATTGLILEVATYPDTTLTTKPATTASLSATKSGLSVVDNKITISEKLSFKPTTSDGTGSVNLSITLPAGYSLEVKNSTDSTTFTASQDGTAVTISASDVPANLYTLVFIVKKDGNIVYGWTEIIVVYAGMTTDAWLLEGATSTAAKEITAATITAAAQKIFYVRGASDTWYSTNLNSATASDSNPGTLMQPLSTVQAAINKVKAVNNGSSLYTIYVDGTVTASGSTPVADFSGFTSGCSIAIKGLDAANKATLDGNGTAQVIVAGIYNGTAIDLNLTLENLIVKNGKGNYGGGISINTTGKVEITNCKITSNSATYGGGVYVYNGTFEMTDGTISENTTSGNGGGVYVNYNGTFNMNGGAISGNTASYGGGVYVYNEGTFTMSGGAISGNTASGSGGGVYVDGTFEMSGGEISGNTADYGGGVYVNGGTLTMTGGEISGNTAEGSGGGVYVDGTFEMSGGEISGNTASSGGGVYVYRTFTMKGGAISGNTAEGNGGGVYVYRTFNMSGAAYIPAGDVYLTSGKYITITGALTGTTPVATITPESYTKGTKVLDGTSDLVATNYTKFNLSSADWRVEETGCLIKKTFTLDEAKTYISNSSGDVAVPVPIASETEFNGVISVINDNANITSIDLTMTVTVDVNSLGSFVEKVKTAVSSSTKISVILDFSNVSGTVNFNSLSGFNHLKELIIPSTLTVQNGTFENCPNLEKVSISCNINNNMFKGCTSLKTVEIGGAVTTIGLDAFNGCTSLETLTLPSSITTFGARAFSSCTSLTTVYYKGSSLDTSTVFPDSPSVQVISDY